MNKPFIYVIVNYEDTDVTFIKTKEEVNEALSYETVDIYYGSPSVEIYAIDDNGKAESVEIKYSMKI